VPACGDGAGQSRTYRAPLAISQNNQNTKLDGTLDVELNAQADENPPNRATQNRNAK
jgi:hypothetical protein